MQPPKVIRTEKAIVRVWGWEYWQDPKRWQEALAPLVPLVVAQKEKEARR